MLVLAASGFGTVVFGLALVMIEPNSWLSTIGRIVIVSGIFILFGALISAARLRKKIRHKLQKK